MSRQDTIVKTSIIGIVVNLILVAFKATVGILVNSIAITLDAVNNLTDALSSIITIIGAKLAGRNPDKQHPYGYGRIEYFSSLIIAAIVFGAGLTALIESLPKILNPDVTSYTTVSLIIIAVAVVVKFLLGRYVKGVGERIESPALVASGSDAFFDSILSFSTLLAAIISIFWHISLEGILGVIISIVIMKASYDMITETLDSMIGARTDTELAGKIKELIMEFPKVNGVHDLDLHNYGPEDVRGTVHIDIDDDLTPVEIQKLAFFIETKILEKLEIIISVEIYAKFDEYDYIQKDLAEILSQYEGILETHAFMVIEEKNLIIWHMIVDFKYDREEIKSNVIRQMKEKYPDYDYYIVDDYDTTDINK